MVKYYNSDTEEYEIENVAGERYLNWTYESPIGRSFLNLLVKKKIFSKLYGKYCDSDLSKKNIHKFIKNFNIDMSLCKKNLFEFESFNDFFSRELISDARPINMRYSSFISPADGRVFAYEDIDLDNIIQVKGYTYSLKELLKDYSTAANYNGGTCVVIRLCPTDYHRFHFVDNGTCSPTTKVKGEYYSVNPVALQKIPQLYCRNKREWSVFSSENFGDILHVEVGATCVGTIVQSYTPSSQIKKGEEKGYFRFGGSTVILFLEPNTVKIDRDIIKQTSLGFETKVNMGQKIGEAI